MMNTLKNTEKPKKLPKKLILVESPTMRRNKTDSEVVREYDDSDDDEEQEDEPQDSEEHEEEEETLVVKPKQAQSGISPQKRQRENSRQSSSQQLKKKLTDESKARVVFESMTGSKDGADFYVWKKSNWKDGKLASEIFSSPKPKTTPKKSPSSKTKKHTWKKLGHKTARKVLADYKSGEYNIQRGLMKKFKKKRPDEKRVIAEDAIEFIETVANHTTPELNEPISDVDVHEIIGNSDMNDFFLANVKQEKNIEKIMKSRADIESEFEKTRAEYLAKEAIFNDKTDLLNWRLAKKAKTSTQNKLATRVFEYLKEHCDPMLESDEIPQSTDVYSDLASDSEND